MLQKIRIIYLPVHGKENKLFVQNSNEIEYFVLFYLHLRKRHMPSS